MTPQDEQQLDFLCGEVSAWAHADTLLHIEANNTAKDPRRAPLLKLTASLVEVERHKLLKQIWEVLSKYFPERCQCVDPKDVTKEDDGTVRCNECHNPVIYA